MAIEIVYIGGDPRKQVQLYRHFAADGSLLYVGISRDSEKRLHQHARDSVWHSSISRVMIETCRDLDEARRKERIAVEAEKPAHNINLRGHTHGCRVSKKRTLERAGFVFVAGWVKAEDAPKAQRMIDAAKAKVDEALKGGENEDRG